jgi:hypothetical protein
MAEKMNRRELMAEPAPAVPGMHKKGFLPRIRRRKKFLIRLFLGLFFLVVLYLLLAYVFLPALWKHYEYQASLENAPKVTRKSFGKAGDPLNVGLVGSEQELREAMTSAGWIPAKPKKLSSGLKIVEKEVLRKKYPDAPVSSLFLWGRKQDLAFEQPAVDSPRQRHHVRFWRTDQHGIGGPPLWLGAASFDRSIGFSRINGEITHHIAPDVDSERDKLMADLDQAGRLIQKYQVTGAGLTFRATNGEGDWYYTDGELTIGVLNPRNAVPAGPAETLPNPGPVKVKNSLFARLRGLLKFFERF